MTNVIELRAFRQRAFEGPAHTPQAAFPSRCPDGQWATYSEAAFLPFTLWRGAAAFWLSLWITPLGFRVEALECLEHRQPAVHLPQNCRRPAPQLGPAHRH